MAGQVTVYSMANSVAVSCRVTVVNNVDAVEVEAGLLTLVDADDCVIAGFAPGEWSSFLTEQALGGADL